ncbi:MAG: OmpA family protein [Treponema sp.]|nr:OmpA family protein [Treponema sp.]
MKKNIIVLSGILFFLALPVMAQENAETGVGPNETFALFSEKVPVYTGFAAGAFFANQYALGEWSNYAVTNFAGGLDVEYTFPRFLFDEMDLGATIHADFGHTIPKSGSNLVSHNDLRLYAGAFLRIPYLFLGHTFAVQPEVGYGLNMSHTVGVKGTKANGIYLDQLFFISPAIRYIAPVDALKNVEFEFSPYWTLSPEQENNSVHDIGFRIGAIFHITDTIKRIKSRAEEKRLALLQAQQEEEARRLQEEKDRQNAEIERLRKEAEKAAADEAEKARIEEELRKAEEAARLAEEARLAAEAEAARIAEEARKAEEERLAREAEEALRTQMQAELRRILKNPELFLGVSKEEIKDFTPDGDGVKDQVVFHPATKYMSDAPENWTLRITDPKGKEIKSWSGEGYPPAEIVWDGRENDGSIIFSRENYPAYLSVTVCELDRERLGRSTLETTIDGNVNIETGIILNQTAENEWKISLTSVSFDPNAATFNKLTRAKRNDLNNMLDEIAKRALAIENMNITVEGYANNVSGTEKEDREELIPLSQIRAEAFAKMLVDRGVSPDIIKAVGMGGANPLASREDQENWWKNRRIEIVIRK